jgi:hypothetical protein
MGWASGEGKKKGKVSVRIIAAVRDHAVNSLGLGTRSLPHPLQVNNVDGSLNQEGSITQYCNLWIRQKDKVVKLGFYVANLGSDRIIFGHPWFKTFNPSIDWSTNCLKGDDFNIETAGYRSRGETSCPYHHSFKIL